ncbi:hypothetical protein Cpin_6686 [Chitinophaga pinensis DSM 2588]|uniref:Sel1 repeat family protein n=1 Tax=Chitinophaga pinensis (strain ATCC 43595 / DSM 2588 / LMG 13176 / NBRC 15968 / NCIMB 11800 / UQM 2034) TaxID=485918 RepID=A0A979GAS5_CHIPD|nr:hypothetical protein Cpin_6686 [Chitinophaga pinensis DSM 2588]
MMYRDLGNYSKVFELHQLTQTLNNTASIELAYCYYYGVGTPIDKRKAFEIFERIAGEESQGTNYQYEEMTQTISWAFLSGGINCGKINRKGKILFRKS